MPARSGAIPLVADPARFDQAKAARQGRVAAALLRLGEVGSVWPLLASGEDPSVRTELIHELAALGVEVRLIVDRLKAERDVSARRCSCSAWENSPAAPSPIRIVGRSSRNCWRDISPIPTVGIHGSLDWLLCRRFGLTQRLAEIVRTLSATALPVGRNWFVNGEGQSFAIVRGPVDLRMGSTGESDSFRQPDEVRHTRRIPRSFAIGMHEVTLAEFSRFLDSKPQESRNSGRSSNLSKYSRSRLPDGGCLVVRGEVLHRASARAGIPSRKGVIPWRSAPGMKLPTDFLTRTGYRLPTKRSGHSVACARKPVRRASSRWTPRPTVEYAWFGQPHPQMHPVRAEEAQRPGALRHPGQCRRVV